MMQTPHRGVAITVVAGVSPAQVRRHCSRHGCLYIRRRPPAITGSDTSLRDVPTVHLSPITNHFSLFTSLLTVSAAQLDVLSGSAWSSA